METSEDAMHTDEKDQMERSTKKVKMIGQAHGSTGQDSGEESQDKIEYGNDPECVTNHQEKKVNTSLSYKSMLLGVNGTRDDYHSDDQDTWMTEDDTEDELQEMVQEQIDPLCPSILVTKDYVNLGEKQL